ncbi:MAG: hypothetical protein RSD04_05450 [Clostridia bacterium]
MKNEKIKQTTKASPKAKVALKKATAVAPKKTIKAAPKKTIKAAQKAAEKKKTCARKAAVKAEKRISSDKKPKKKIVPNYDFASAQDYIIKGERSIRAQKIVKKESGKKPETIDSYFDLTPEREIAYEMIQGANKDKKIDSTVKKTIFSK